MASRSTLRFREGFVPTTFTVRCPIQTTLGALGRKWALPILRDVTFFENVRFSDLLANNAGLTPRVLSFRLAELQEEGYLVRVEQDGSITYDLTEKGRDAAPILGALIGFGIKHHARTVFKDHRPRDLGEFLPGASCALLERANASARPR